MSDNNHSNNNNEEIKLQKRKRRCNEEREIYVKVFGRQSVLRCFQLVKVNHQEKTPSKLIVIQVEGKHRQDDED